MKSICVYLGANFGSSHHFKDAAIQLGTQIVNSNARLVYGGSSLGLMGLLANTVMDLGGKVTSVITESLIAQEQPFTSLDELVITKTMQERKILMQQKADAFIVMPGGLGTLEEAFDTWNAIKIGIINKPIGFLNINSYFDDLFSFISHAGKHGFVAEAQVQIPKINANSALLISELLDVIPPYYSQAPAAHKI